MRLLVLDPFALTPWPSAAYNPLAALEPKSLDLAEDAATLADALVLDPPAQVQDAHWNEEAKALLAGLILMTVCREEPPQRRVSAATHRGRLVPLSARTNVIDHCGTIGTAKPRDFGRH